MDFIVINYTLQISISPLLSEEIIESIPIFRSILEKGGMLFDLSNK